MTHIFSPHFLSAGKTFVAAVVMYNYWRWFPRGKIIFMAPTKPLVVQQVESCYGVSRSVSRSSGRDGLNPPLLRPAHPHLSFPCRPSASRWRSRR